MPVFQVQAYFTTGCHAAQGALSRFGENFPQNKTRGDLQNAVPRAILYLQGAGGFATSVGCPSVRKPKTEEAQGRPDHASGRAFISNWTPSASQLAIRRE